MRPFIVGSTFLLTACALSQAQPEMPAVIIQPTPDSRAELLAAVIDVLDNASLTLADDALTQSSSLIVEQARTRDASGRQLSGRDLGRPQHFQLVENGGRCVLIHEESGKRAELTRTTCKPL